MTKYFNVKTLYYIIIFVVVLSCGNRQVNSTKQAEIDSVKPIYSNQQNNEKIKEISDNDYDSWRKHNTDSLTQVVKYIKKHEHIAINQRIIRIKQLYNSIIYPGNVWLNSDLEVDQNEILSNEIGLLLNDSLIIHYNIDSLFTSIDKNIYVCHSEDRRLWAISYMPAEGGNANSPENILAWRDSCNKPFGYTLISEKDREIVALIFIEKIYSLKNILHTNLYLLMGESKDFGNNAFIIELKQNSLNKKYKGFEHNGIKTIAYKFGIAFDSKGNSIENYNFNVQDQTIRFQKQNDSYNEYSETEINGILTFNGKYFEEKLSKRKVK